MSIAISQGDYIYYQDTSTGAPTGWSWVFQGGTPTGSASQNPVVLYQSPSPYAGYTTTLTVTKDLLVSTKVEASAVYVNPETLYIEISAAPTLIPMSTNVSYSVTGTTGSIAYYTWYLPGVTGFTGPNNILNQNVTLNSWFDATGTEYGSAYSTYSINALVYGTSFLSNTTANAVLVDYSKNGPLEQINFASNLYDPLTVYYTATKGIADTTAVGLPGNGWVVDVACPGGELNNPYFRAQGEFIYYVSSSMDIGDTFPYISNGVITGQLVASSVGFIALGVPTTGWESLNRYTIGQYMLPSDIIDYFSGHLYFGDINNGLSGLLKPQRGWTESQVFDLVFSTSVANQTSKSMELAFGYLPQATLFGFDGYNGASGGKGGCCLPSSNVAGGNIDIYIDIYYSPDGSIDQIDPGQTYTIIVPISNPSINGGNGNSPDARLILAQDTISDTGIATKIQAGLDDYFINVLSKPLNTYIQASASPEYAYQYSFANYDVDVFNGLKLTILANNPLDAAPYIAKVGLRDSLAANTMMPYSKTAAFGTVSAYTGIWTCFYYDYLANPYQASLTSYTRPVRGFSYYTPFY